MQRVTGPVPSSPAATAKMRANRRRDTGPELALRRSLHRRGLRFRKDFRVATAARSVRVDVAFPALRLAIFVDGCFWHSCPEHASVPKANADYWIPKLAENVARDRRNDLDLSEAGWTVVRLWEHESVDAMATRVGDCVDHLRSRAPALRTPP
jgi:DNA mismatch endonuclease (patch repair protein)